MANMDYLRFFAALALVLGLIGLCAWLARRFRLSGLAGAAAPSGRLAVIETLPIDGRRRLALIRRDDQEHLLMIGQERCDVIETGIASRSAKAGGAPEPGRLAAP
jgi:flagellar protein FliO/FliZ